MGWDQLLQQTPARRETKHRILKICSTVYMLLSSALRDVDLLAAHSSEVSESESTFTSPHHSVLILLLAFPGSNDCRGDGNYGALCLQPKEQGHDHE
jgi:hypothetical protein